MADCLIRPAVCFFAQASRTPFTLPIGTWWAPAP